MTDPGLNVRLVDGPHAAEYEQDLMPLQAEHLR